MSKQEEKFKAQVLGQPVSTAGSKLRKMLLFKYLQLANEDICYRCNKLIDNIEDLSIEHKQAWLHHPKGRELYFDLDNISFSHRECNSAASKTYKDGIHPSKGRPSPHKGLRAHKYPIQNEQAWCLGHKKYLPVENFHKDNGSFIGIKPYCKECRSSWRKIRYRENLSR